MRRRTYNPAHLTPAELKSSFTARSETLALMLRILRGQQPDHPCQHLLLVGARGMGKTTLGLRFLQAVGEEPDLAAVWQPVRFDEESYAVTNVGEFWLTAMQHLARATGEDRWRERARDLRRGEPDAARREAYALAALLDFCDGGRRLILFVENLDMVFEQMRSERDLHAMRSALIEHPEFLLVGSANSVFEGIRERTAPFYEFFQRINLGGVGSEACRAVFEGTFRREGTLVPAGVLSDDAARVETIRTLTGGSPRLLVLAAEILMESPLGSAFEHLERLIDEQTPYFKALIEALPVQARKVFHHLAGEWTPLRARDIADGTSLTASHVSAQLRQLMDRAYVREAHVLGEARVRYEVADRFYGMYYLLRFSPASRERLARFVAFLHDLYGDQGMHSLYPVVLQSLRERPMPATELADWVHVFSGQVAEDQGYPGRNEWLEGVLKTSVEQLGPEAPVLDDLQTMVAGALQVFLEHANELMRSGRLDEAESMLDRAARHPDSPTDAMLHLKGLVQMQAGRSEAALGTLREATAVAGRRGEDGRMTKTDALLAMSRLRLEAGKTEAARDLALEGSSLARKRDPARFRAMFAHQLRSLAAGLREAERPADAVQLWLRVPELARHKDGSGLRRQAAQALCDAGESLVQTAEYDQSCATLQEVDAWVRGTDREELRAERLRALALEGICHWSLERHDEALAIWQRARDYMLPGDTGRMSRFAAACLGSVSVGLIERAKGTASLADSLEWARMAVDAAPGESLPLQLYAHALAHNGEWRNALATLGLALENFDDAEAPTGMLGTLIRIASDGHVREVRDFMAGTRLTKDFEPLWYALELELGTTVDALPAEVNDVVCRVRAKLSGEP